MFQFCPNVVNLDGNSQHFINNRIRIPDNVTMQCMGWPICFQGHPYTYIRSATAIYNNITFLFCCDATVVVPKMVTLICVYCIHVCTVTYCTSHCCELVDELVIAIGRTPFHLTILLDKDTPADGSGESTCSNRF